MKEGGERGGGGGSSSYRAKQLRERERKRNVRGNIGARERERDGNLMIGDGAMKSAVEGEKRQEVRHRNRCGGVGTRVAMPPRGLCSSSLSLSL